MAPDLYLRYPAVVVVRYLYINYVALKTWMQPEISNVACDYRVRRVYPDKYYYYYIYYYIL